MNCNFSLKSAVICVYLLGNVLVHIYRSCSINGIDVEVVSSEKDGGSDRK